MKTIKFRELLSTEIDIRVGSTKKNTNGDFEGFQLLLYKDARVDANILDETVGAFNWQKKFYQVKNTMICSVGINVNYDDPNKEPYWVWKDDAGDESETEAIKGEASDSFKRASGGSCWGIGRALYGAPFIWVKVDNDNHPKKSHYQVKEIDYKNGEITKLVIINEKTKQVVFSMGSTTKVSQTAQKPTQNVNEYGEVKSNPKPTLEELGKGIGDSFLEESSISDTTKEKILEITGKFDGSRYEKFKTYLYNTFQVSSIGDLTEKQGKQLLNVLSK